MDDIKQQIEEYFKGFFDEIKFYTNKSGSIISLSFDGLRNGNVYAKLLPHNMYGGDMLFHWLENIKGDIVNHEEQILLEK